MPVWMRFRYENGNSSVCNAEDVILHFKVEEPYQVEVQALSLAEAAKNKITFVYPCANMEQVYAAEDLIFQALNESQSVTITLEGLEEHAEHLNHIYSIRMVLNLLHHGSLRVPVSYDYPQGEELFMDEDGENSSEIRQFERMLHTYLEAPENCLRRAYRRAEQKNQPVGEDCPFRIVWGHEECEDHGFHEHWQVFTLPDRNYHFREGYQTIAHSVAEKEGFQLIETPKKGISITPQSKQRISS